MKTTRRSLEELESLRMTNAENTPLHETSATVRISAEEKRLFRFLRETEMLLRDAKISYDYNRTTFIIPDPHGDMCIWYSEYEGLDDNIYVGTADQETYYESFTNPLDAVNYVHDQIK